MSNLAHIFPTAPDLDRDLENVGILMDRDNVDDPMEYPNYLATLRPQTQSKFNWEYSKQFRNICFLGESGDVTPVSGCSEIEMNTNDATAGSTADCDVTVTEDIEGSIIMGEDEDFSESVFLPSTPIFNTPEQQIDPNVQSKFKTLHSPTVSTTPLKKLDTKTGDLKQKQNDTKLSPSSSGKKDPSFFEDFVIQQPEKTIPTSSEAVVKENCIELPKITRISKSFHCKSPTPQLEIDLTPRRASDIPYSSKSSFDVQSLNKKHSKTQGNKAPRFTTTLVDEAEHAASMGIPPYTKNVSNENENSPKKC